MKSVSKIVYTAGLCLASVVLSALIFSLVGGVAGNRAAAAGAVTVGGLAAMIYLVVKGRTLLAGIILSGAIIGLLSGFMVLDDVGILVAEKVFIDSPADVVKHPEAEIFYLKEAELKEEYARVLRVYERKDKKGRGISSGSGIFVPLVSKGWTPDRAVEVYVYTPASTSMERDLKHLRDTSLILYTGAGDPHHMDSFVREAAAADKLILADGFRVFITSADPVASAKDSIVTQMFVIIILIVVQVVIAARYSMKKDD